MTDERLNTVTIGTKKLILYIIQFYITTRHWHGQYMVWLSDRGWGGVYTQAKLWQQEVHELMRYFPLSEPQFSFAIKIIFILKAPKEISKRLSELIMNNLIYIFVCQSI